mgnify:CR=1 FL=1
MTGDTKITGKELFHILRSEYGIELEMSEISYVTAMTSICDTKEALGKLCEAFLETDESLYHVPNPGQAVIPAAEQVMTPYEARSGQEAGVSVRSGRRAQCGIYIFISSGYTAGGAGRENFRGNSAENEGVPGTEDEFARSVRRPDLHSG